jgi:hypothetical protein
MPTASSDVLFRGSPGRHLLRLSSSEFDPTETSSPDRIGPAINMMTAKALGINIPATPLGARLPIL